MEGAGNKQPNMAACAESCARYGGCTSFLWCGIEVSIAPRWQQLKAAAPGGAPAASEAWGTGAILAAAKLSHGYWSGAPRQASALPVPAVRQPSALLPGALLQAGCVVDPWGGFRAKGFCQLEEAVLAAGVAPFQLASGDPLFPTAVGLPVFPSRCTDLAGWVAVTGDKRGPVACMGCRSLSWECTAVNKAVFWSKSCAELSLPSSHGRMPACLPSLLQG